MWLTDGFLVTFLEGGGELCAYTWVKYSYCTRCTVHGELTCGGGGNIRIHVYLQLPYMVHRTRCTHVWWWGQYTHTCVPTATVHGALYTVYSRVVVGAIYAYMCTYSYRTRCTCVHVYLQLPYTVHRTWCTVHGVPYTVNSHVEGAFMCGSYSRVQGTFTCGSYSRVRRATKWNSSLLDIFPILCQIRLIRRIRWIQREPVKHGWRLLQAFLCLLLTVWHFGVMVSMPDCWSVNPWFKPRKSLSNIFYCLIRWIPQIFQNQNTKNCSVMLDWF